MFNQPSSSLAGKPITTLPTNHHPLRPTFHSSTILSSRQTNHNSPYLTLNQSPPSISLTDLEPINGAAVDERREHSQAVAEGIADGAEGKDDVKVAADALHKLVVHVERGDLNLRILQLTQELHLEARRLETAPQWPVRNTCV